MNAMTSERLGVPAEPPSRVHLMPATAAPKHMASTSLWPSASVGQAADIAVMTVAWAPRSSDLVDLKSDHHPRRLRETDDEKKKTETKTKTKADCDSRRG